MLVKSGRYCTPPRTRFPSFAVRPETQYHLVPNTFVPGTPVLRRILATAAIVSALALGAALSACGGGESAPASPAKLSIVATLAPIGAIARSVGGELAEVRVLVKPGVDPHEYELKPDDRKAIDGARVVLVNGLEIDAFIARADARGDALLVTLTDGLALRTGDGGGKDPHAWHDATLVAAMIDRAVDAFASADAANAATYRANGAAAKARLAQADTAIKALIAAIPQANRRMVTNHDAFGYFIERYGLEYVGAVIPGTSSAAEASAKDLAALVDLIKREGVRAIFAESSIDPKVAREIAKDTGVRIVDDLYGDSLGEPGSGADTIEGMLLANARKIAEALR